MRALTYAAFGATPVVTTLPDPSPPPGGAVVRVTASGLCRSDWHGWMGHDSDITTFPHVPGHELAGVVEAVGEGVDAGWLGRAVTAAEKDQVIHHDYRNFLAGIASGSFPTAGMVICPCSMGTVGAIAHGLSENLIHRAADVHLKERRKLVLVPRETPLHLIQLRNLTACAEAGAVVMPAMPAFYTLPRTVQDCVDFIVGRVGDQFGVEHQLLRRWSE